MDRKNKNLFRDRVFKGLSTFMCKAKVYLYVVVLSTPMLYFNLK